MKNYQQAVQKGKEELKKKAELVTYFGDGYYPKDEILTFLDSYAQDIRLAVIEDLKEKDGTQT